MRRLDYRETKVESDRQFGGYAINEVKADGRVNMVVEVDARLVLKVGSIGSPDRLDVEYIKKKKKRMESRMILKPNLSNGKKKLPLLNGNAVE